MAKLISDAHLSLAYRLGESASPSTTSEKAKRLNWFQKAVSIACGGDELMWFMQTHWYDVTIANRQYYTKPTLARTITQIKVDGYEYEFMPYDEVYRKYEVPSSPVPILPAFLARSFYTEGSSIYFIPIPSAAATSQTLTSVTSSGTACTATLVDHGYLDGEYVTIAGAVQTAYNGTFRITYVSSSVFTYTAASTPAATPATGTVTATKNNIIIKGYANPTAPTADASSIVVPDDYEDLLVSYAEARYWSAAQKRGKSADAFAEFEELLSRLKRDNFRHKYATT